MGFFIDVKFKSSYDNWLLENENGRFNIELMLFDVVNWCIMRVKVFFENDIYLFYIYLIFIRFFGVVE